MARLCLKSARERKDLDSELTQQIMRNYAKASYNLHGPTKESKEALSELLVAYRHAYMGPMPHRHKRQETVLSCNLRRR